MLTSKSAFHFWICFIKHYIWILAVYDLTLYCILVLIFYRFEDDRKYYSMHEWFSKTIIFLEKTCCNKSLKELSSYHVNCFQNESSQEANCVTFLLSKLISHPCWNPIFIAYVADLQTFYLTSLLCHDFTHAFPIWVSYILSIFSLHSYFMNKIIQLPYHAKLSYCPFSFCQTNTVR